MIKAVTTEDGVKYEEQPLLPKIANRRIIPAALLRDIRVKHSVNSATDIDKGYEGF